MSHNVYNHSGGAYEGDAKLDLIRTGPFHAPVTVLSGATDAITRAGLGNYVVSYAGVDAMTLFTPVAGLDDGFMVAIYSDTANAHSITCGAAIIARGSGALATSATLTAQRGAGIILRAWAGTWQVIASNGTVTYA